MSSHVDDDGVALAVGTRHEGEIDAFEFADTFTVELAAGQAIDVYVGAVAGDMAHRIYPAGAEADDITFVDDSDEGLLGLDAHEDFVAHAAGAYTIEVGTFEVISIGYVLDVQPG